MLREHEFAKVTLTQESLKQLESLGIPVEWIIAEAAVGIEPLEYRSGRQFGWLVGLTTEFAQALHEEKKETLGKIDIPHKHSEPLYILHLVNMFYRFSLKHDSLALAASDIPTKHLAAWVKAHYYRDDRFMAFAIERQTKQAKKRSAKDAEYSFQFNERGLPTPSNLNPNSAVVEQEYFPNTDEFSAEYAQRIRWSYKHKETFNKNVLEALALRLAEDAENVYPLLAGLELADNNSMLRPEQILLRKILPSLGSLEASKELEAAKLDVAAILRNVAKLLVDVCLTEIAGEGLRITKRNFIFTKPFPSDIAKESDGDESDEEVENTQPAAFSPEFVLACFEELPYFIEHLKELVLDGTSLLVPVLDWIKLEYIPQVVEPTFATLPNDHHLRAAFITAARAVNAISLNPADLHKPAKKRKKIMVPYSQAYRKRLRYFRDLREE